MSNHKVKRKASAGDPAKVGRLFGGYDMGGDADSFKVTGQICTADDAAIPADELEDIPTMELADFSAATQKAVKAAFKLIRKDYEAAAFPVEVA